MALQREIDDVISPNFVEPLIPVNNTQPDVDLLPQDLDLRVIRKEAQEQKITLLERRMEGVADSINSLVYNGIIGKVRHHELSNNPLTVMGSRLNPSELHKLLIHLWLQEKGIDQKIGEETAEIPVIEQKRLAADLILAIMINSFKPLGPRSHPLSPRERVNKKRVSIIERAFAENGITPEEFYRKYLPLHFIIDDGQTKKGKEPKE